MVWRRLLVKDTTSISELHYILQILMNWTDSNLHQFIIYGKSYGVVHDGRIDFSDDPTKILLCNFQFCLNERFIYQYNFFVHWELEIRLEKKLSFNAKQLYPTCIGGNRASPPEDCGGTIEFMKLLEHYNTAYIMEFFCKFLKKCKSKKTKETDLINDMEFLNYWINIHKFNRRKVNEILKKFILKDPDWAEYMEEVIDYESENTDCF
jgi:hypothetical protein